jgi:hypothetical protein
VSLDLPATAVVPLARLVELAGTLNLAIYCVRALAMLVRSRGSGPALTRARLVISDGIVATLSIDTAAALLKTVELRSWPAIAEFAAILTLRWVMKRAARGESRRARTALAPSSTSSLGWTGHRS